MEVIESMVIRRLAEMVNLPTGTYKMSENFIQGKRKRDLETGYILHLLNESTEDVAKLEQDNSVAKFLRGRR